jgi:hypothetical protein
MTKIKIQDDRDDVIMLLDSIKKLQDEMKPMLKRIKAHELDLDPECTIFTITSRSGSHVTYSKGADREGFKTGERAIFVEKIMSDPKVWKWFQDTNKITNGAWTKGTLVILD